MTDCVFCKIAKKEMAAQIIFQDDEVMVFKDINPKADIHLLIAPKEHIESINHLTKKDEKITARLIFVAKEIAQQQGVAQNGYRLQFNVGRGGGQIIDHLHLHLLADKKL